MEIIPLGPPPVPTSSPKIDYCFDLELVSNAETYPEFSWKELVKEAQDKKATKRAANGKQTIDPYASDDDDDLRALAARLEKRYQNTGAKDKRRKRKAEDYIDRGAGYDETDSFIDNSEVYDEIVPEDIQPVHGGFYINSGRLDFKDADVSECDVDEEIEEQRQQGRKFSKSMDKSGKKSTGHPNKKASGGVKRRRGRPAAGENATSKSSPASKATEGASGSSKKSDSPKSSSNSPLRPGKSRVMMISSQSESSSSDSSGTSSSSSSDSDKDDGEPTPPPKPKVVVSNVSTTINSIASPKSLDINVGSPQAARRLKVKNVPLNPKLHGDSVPVSQPQPVQQPKPVTPSPPSKKTPPQPQSNREIFGSLPPVSGIQPGLSSTSIVPAGGAAIRPSTSQKQPTVQQSRNFAAPSPKSKSRRRVTDRLTAVTNVIRKPSITHTSPSSASPAKKRQKIDAQIPIPSRAPPPPVLTAKKPRKPRVSTLNRNAAPPAPLASPRALTAEEQHQLLIQHLQLHPQLSSLGLGLSHLLPMLGGPSLPPPLPTPTPTTKEPRRKKRANPNTAASDVLKSLATFQTQVGSGVTVSEVKKTKPHTVSPSSGSLVALNSPKSNTPPSRLSTPSPNNIPRIPIPSSITVTAASRGQQRSANSSSVNSPNSNSPNFQPVSSNANKTFTDFHMNALLSKTFHSNNSSGK